MGKWFGMDGWGSLGPQLPQDTMPSSRDSASKLPQGRLADPVASHCPLGLGGGEVAGQF